MDLLPNISITTADLTAKRPNLSDYLDAGQEDFSDYIEEAKRSLFIRIKQVEYKNHPHYSDKELSEYLNERIYDIESTQNLKSIIVFSVISAVFRANDMIEVAESYDSIAQSTVLQYFVDEDEDTTEDLGEKRHKSGITFTR